MKKIKLDEIDKKNFLNNTRDFLNLIDYITDDLDLSDFKIFELRKLKSYHKKIVENYYFFNFMIDNEIQKKRKEIKILIK